MIYNTGERVDFLPFTSENQDRAVFQLTDEHGELVMLPLSVANGGLVQRRKNALHPVFNAPAVPGRYSYRFADGDQVRSGTIKVQPLAAVRSQPEPDAGLGSDPKQGVRARRRG